MVFIRDLHCPITKITGQDTTPGLGTWILLINFSNEHLYIRCFNQLFLVSNLSHLKLHMIVGRYIHRKIHGARICMWQAVNTYCRGLIKG